MLTETKSSEPVRELRLEGAGLVVVGAALLALVAGAFLLGRWVERRSPPSSLATVVPPSADSVPAAPEDAPAAEPSAFDRASERQAEPQREVSAPARPVEAAPASPPEPTAAAAPAPAVGGPYFVQVSSGRIRAAAETLTEVLRSAGYPAALVTEREGSDELLKVRVGGYASHDEARRVAEELAKRGHPGAWVPPLE